MADSNVDRQFLGRGWRFPPEFDLLSRAATLAAGEQDIHESLRILLGTTPGERVMQPAYGCGLKALIFDTISESSVTEIRDAVERAVLFFEPRITLDRIAVDTTDMLDGLVAINLDFHIRATNTRSNVVYPFYFREGTNVRT